MCWPQTQWESHASPLSFPRLALTIRAHQLNDYAVRRQQHLSCADVHQSWVVGAVAQDLP
jgi:hypothetical protein